MKTGLPQSNVFVINDYMGETVPLNVTSVSSSVTFFNAASAKNFDCMIVNAGPSTVFFGVGTKAVGVTATVPATTGTIYATPILSGAIYNVQKNTDAVNADTIAAICAGSGTATIYITSVQGS